jgi:hypothetical protein
MWAALADLATEAISTDATMVLDDAVATDLSREFHPARVGFDDSGIGLNPVHRRVAGYENMFGTHQSQQYYRSWQISPEMAKNPYLHLFEPTGDHMEYVNNCNLSEASELVYDVPYSTSQQFYESTTPAETLPSENFNDYKNDDINVMADDSNINSDLNVDNSGVNTMVPQSNVTFISGAELDAYLNDIEQHNASINPTMETDHSIQNTPSTVPEQNMIDDASAGGDGGGGEVMGSYTPEQLEQVLTSNSDFMSSFWENAQSFLAAGAGMIRQIGLRALQLFKSSAEWAAKTANNLWNLASTLFTTLSKGASIGSRLLKWGVGGIFTLMVLATTGYEILKDATSK